MKKGLGVLFLGVYLVSTAFFYDKMPVGNSQESIFEEGAEVLQVSAADFGAMCISAAYPNLQLTGVTDTDNDNEEPVVQQIITSDYQEAEPEPVIFGDDPVVLIVHTHATESYLPASEGNYHTTALENSVRDVGSVLAKTLESKGISAVHDQTLHDSPSYNQSYSRSYVTTSELLEKYPSVQCVIDLHRDAISSDSPAATVSVSGRTCARYSYVVSTAVPTYDSNLKFIDAMNRTAEADFQGFTGKILERGYRYNQDLSRKYMLLEIGYNRNTIEDARNTAEIFAEILAETLKEF